MEDKIIDAIRKYADRVWGYRDQLQKWNEDEVKGYLIEPLLSALLWDPTDPNFVRRKYPVSVGSKTTWADYALMSGENPICIIEAKAGELDDNAAKQALSYTKILNVPWALVTNGQRLCLYGADFYKSENTINALVMDIVISPENINTALESLNFLANGMLDTKETNDKFKTFNERRALLVFLKSEKDTLVKDVIAKWIEENWGKGSVDKALLLSSLENLFGRIEPPQIPVSRARTAVVASDWKHRDDLRKGIFELKSDPTKQIDVSLSGPEVENQLEKLGLRLSSPSAFGGFYFTLRREASLIRKR